MRSRLAKFLVLIAFLVYLPVFDNGFVWDDFFFITENVYVTEPSNWGKLWSSNTTAGAGILDEYYRPLTSLSFGVDYQIWGDWALGFHLTQVALHALAGVLVFGLLVELGMKQNLSFFAALFFLVHPAQVQAVAYMASRGDQGYVVLALLGLLAFERSFGGGRKGLLVGACVGFYVAAILAKEFGLASILLFGLVWLVKSGAGFGSLKDKIRETWPQVVGLVALGLVAAGYLLLRASLLRFTGGAELDLPPEYQSSLVVRLLTMPALVWQYLGILFWPSQLYFHRTSEIYTALSWSLLGLVGLVGLGVGVSWFEFKKRGSGWVGLGLIWFVGMLLPVLGLIPISALIREHWLYFALVGMAVAVVAGLDLAVGKNEKLQRLVFGVGLPLVVLVLAGLSFVQIGVWQDQERLYRYNLEISPSDLMHNNLGLVFIKQGRLGEAREQIGKALELNPEMVQAYGNLALIAKASGDGDGVESNLLKALGKRPDYVPGRKQLVTYYLEEREYELALEQTEKLIESSPEDWQVLVMQGKLHLLLGDDQAADKSFERAAQVGGETEFVRETIEKVKQSV